MVLTLEAKVVAVTADIVVDAAAAAEDREDAVDRGDLMNAFDYVFRVKLIKVMSTEKVLLMYAKQTVPFK